MIHNYIMTLYSFLFMIMIISDIFVFLIHCHNLQDGITKYQVLANVSLMGLKCLGCVVVAREGG